MSLVGRSIGRYKILEQLGQGGMSVVYKGFDTALDREVAVKVLHPHLAGKEESRKRLAREAKAVARLRHPNILEVFDFADADSKEAFIVTEYIRGKTLREVFSATPFEPPEVAAMVVHEIAAALAHAHEAGVLHRDLKPENLMLRDDGVLKLMDFGIAKILDKDDKMTMTGALVGSPAHMAPEIIEGEEAGPEADVFSLGTMLYLFTTGRLPFIAANTTATLRKILDCSFDDPRQLNPLVSDGLAEIISRCLSRAPADRYPQAGALREALAGYLAELSIARVHEELPAFFLDPGGYRKALTQRLTAALLSSAQQLLDARRPARALATLNHVLALDGNNAQATALLGQLKASKAREKRKGQLTRASAVGAALAVLAALGVQGAVWARRVPDFPLPPLSDPFVARIPEEIYPAAPQPSAPPGEARATELPLAPPASPPVDGSFPREARPRLSERARGELLEVAVNIRPFGYLVVDGGPKSDDALARHVLKLTRGRHRLTVGCERCESGGRTFEVEVGAGAQGPFNLAAPLKASKLSFRGWADGAVVRVGRETRAVAESLERPFEISMPPEGNPQMLHRVRYEVLVAGAVVDSGEKTLEPGKAEILEKGQP